MEIEKVGIKIVPTPATQEISPHDIAKLSRITKLPEERIRDRISKGKVIVIITANHPRIAEVVELIRSFGFSVTTGAPEELLAEHRTAKKSQMPTTKKKLEARLEPPEWRPGDVIENLYEVMDTKYGGMGAVYLVRHLRWNQMMAVKSLHKHLRRRAEDRGLFVKEAETWIDIGFHPNIAACYYVRNILDSPRIFIEYVDGGSLNEWLANLENPGWDLIIDLMVQFCDGLDHAHSKGLVHRDVKPANCMMTRDGVLKVTDFGLTKRTNQESKVDATLDLSLQDTTVVVEKDSVTAAGMGTPGFMAPEMWIPNAEVGPAVDVYAFGVMLFEITCGRKPFVLRPGERRDKLARAHLKKAPPAPSQFRPDMPPAIEELILTCLNKDPQDRPESFAKVREDLVRMYRDLFNKEFPRKKPDEVELLADALNNRALSMIDLNHEAEAEAHLRKAIMQDPHHPEALYNLGLLEWNRSGDPNWDVVVKLEEAVKTAEYTARGGHLLGRCLLRLGDARRAVNAFELSLSSSSTSDEWLQSYGIALLGAGRTEDGVNRLKAYVKEFPHDEEATRWLVGALWRQRQQEEALALLHALTSDSPGSEGSAEEVADTHVGLEMEPRLVLQEHTGWVTAVVCFPGSGNLITAGRDRTLKIWTVDGGELTNTINVVGTLPAQIAISPDERFVAVAGGKGGELIKILDLETGKFVGNLATSEGTITVTCFSPDGTRVLTLGGDGNSRFWDTEGYKPAEKIKRLPPHTAAAVMFDAANRPVFFAAGLDRVVKRVAIAGAELEIQQFEKVHSEAVTVVKVTPDGHRVITGGRDKLVVLWDGRSGKPECVFQLHQDMVSEVAVNPRLPLAASCDPKGGLKLWDTTTGMVLRTYEVNAADLTALTFTPDGSGLICGGRDAAIRIWDVRGRVVTPHPALTRIRSVRKQMKWEQQFSRMIEKAKKAVRLGDYPKAYALLRKSLSLPGYERSELPLGAIVRIRDHGTRVNLHGGWNRRSLDTGSGVRAISFSSSAIGFITAQLDHTIRVWSTKTGDCLQVLKGHTNVVGSVAYAPNGREASSGSDDRTIRIWDLNTGRNLAIIKGHTDLVSSVAYSADGAMILSGSWDDTVRVWRVSDKTLVKTLKGHEDHVAAVTFMGDSGMVVSAGYGGGVKMWDVASGRQLRELKAHKDRVMSVKVSPEGNLLLTGSMDGTAVLWDARKGMLLKTFSVGSAGIRAVGFSPDQKFMLTAGEDCILRVWNIDSGACLREFKGHSTEITGAEFASHGQFIVSCSADGTVMIWELDWTWEF
ncbi:MAG: protein kinase [Thermodesulfobacteriota bacterium]